MVTNYNLLREYRIPEAEFLSLANRGFERILKEYRRNYWAGVGDIEGSMYFTFKDIVKLSLENPKVEIDFSEN